MAALKQWLSPVVLAAAVTASPLFPRQDDNTVNLSSCPGYTASNVQQTSSGLTADLTLAGDACNAYGDDLQDLTLTVEYQTGKALFSIESPLESLQRSHTLIRLQTSACTSSSKMPLNKSTKSQEPSSNAHLPTPLPPAAACWTSSTRRIPSAFQ